MYETKSVNKLFTKNYTPFTQKLWEKKKIPGYKRKVTNLEVDLFFASELYNILMQLGDYYNLRYYRRMAEYIKKNTYLNNLDKNIDVKVDINRLNSILNDTYKPKDFQEEFIKKYFEYKEIYDLDGYILSFDQGLGKTFTAACISELIHPDQTIIVCMNTLKENWANELRLYFKKYNDIERFKREVYVYGVSKPKEYSNDTRYIIVNNESINKIFPLVKNTNSTMIIVDESQNFRNLDSLQTKNMLKLKQITKSKDNLMMSGTPIKANPSEIVPAMMMIDRTFTLDLAKLYIKAFTSNTDTLSDVVQTRFNRTIYRKTKDQVLDLPSKTVTNFKLEYKDEDPYLMINVKKRVADRFQEILESYKDEVDSVKDEFRETTLKYSSQDRTTTLDYIKFVDKGQDYESVHDSLYDLYDGFIKNNVYPNIKDKDELKRYKYVVSVYVYITQKCFFLAMGEVLPKVKAKAFNELYDNNKDLIYKMINNNPKKTVIFSTIVEVVDHICDDLNKNDIKAVKITGSVKNRMDIINQFREDDTIDVLVATSQTMGTGVTLVEANQMMVFCPPYRKADFDQACDRIYRIGQTHPVNIYNIIGSTSSKDITTRMTDILDWSDQMVSSVLDNIVNEEALIEKYKGEDTNMVVFEEAIYDSKHTEPVYIVLMHTGTMLANTIKAVTKDEFSHSCISFTSKLDPMFSFGNKKMSYVAGQPGFVQQNTKDEFFKKKKSIYEVYVMFVSKSQKQKMIDRLKWFKEKDKYLGYDIIGLIKYKLGISSDDNLKKWFCSRFVAELLGQAEDLGRDASLFSPQDFKNDLNFISLVNKGDNLYNYDYKITERNLKKIKEGDYNMESSTDLRLSFDTTLNESKKEPHTKGVEYDLDRLARDSNKKTDINMKRAVRMVSGGVSQAQKGKNIIGTTSTGADMNDSVLKSRIEDFDKASAQAILEAEDIVKAYNLWVDGQIDNIMRTGVLSSPDHNEVVQSAKSIKNAMQGCGVPDEKIRDYLKGTYFYTTDDPEKIEKLLSSRVKYCDKITAMLKEMLVKNGKILGYSKEELDLMINSLDNGNAGGAIKKIKTTITANPQKFLTNNGECLDLSSLGFGKVFMTKSADFTNSFKRALNQSNPDSKQTNFDQAVDSLLQKAMVYDAIVTCHGMSSNDIGYFVSDKMTKLNTVAYKAMGVDTTYVPSLYKKGKTMDKDNKKGLLKVRWMMQPVRSDRSNYFNDMNSFLRELMKEGYRKILVAACNPGGHSLDKDTLEMKKKTGTKILYSDFSNFIESASTTDNSEYDLDNEFIQEALDGEYELIQLAESYGIDYNSIPIDIDYSTEILSEDSLVLNKIKEYGKKAVEFIIGIFKKLWQYLKKFVAWIGKKLGIIKGENDEATNPVSGSLVVFESAKMLKFRTNKIKELEKLSVKACSSIEKELTMRQSTQVKSAKQLEMMLQKVQNQSTHESALLTETLEDFLNNGMTVSESLALNEATLSSKERKSLPDKTFGLPEKRKFPLNDYDHVVLAIKFFNRCDKKDQEELAKNIIKAMKVYKVPTDKIGKNNKLRNYINGPLKEFAIREGIGDLFKYKTEYKEIPPKVQKKDAINKVYQIGDKLLNSEKYKSVKKYVKKVFTDKDQYAAFLKGENNYYHLYTYKVPYNAQGRRDMFGPKFNEKEDNDYNWVDDSLIYKFGDELIDQVKQMDDCYSISDADNEMYEGDFYLEYFKKTQKIKVNKKTGEVVKESVVVPVVGLTNKTPVIVDNMYNNAFTSLEMDEEIIRNCMMSSTKALLNKEDKFYVPYIPYIQESLNIDPNIGFYRDRNGIFVMNENTKLRSPSYNDVDDIDDRTILYITYGELNDSKLNDL